MTYNRISYTLTHIGRVFLTVINFISRTLRFFPTLILFSCPRGSHLRGGDVTVYVIDINQPSLLTPYSVLVSISVFMALSTVLHSIILPDNSPFSLTVFPVFFLPYWSFQQYISL